MAPGSTLGGTFLADDGYIQPPRNVLAYTVAMAEAGVEVHERVSFDGLVVSGQEVVGVETSGGAIATPMVVLTGGPQLAAVGRQAGTRIPAGGVRHQVAVTEPHPDFDPVRLPMVFDVLAGLYWRPEEGGLLFGMSNPDEPPGEATEIDWPYLEKIRRRLAELVPATASLGLRKVWAATIDYTPDHLPILGPALGPDGPIGGTTVASAGGHGMMWGPAVLESGRRPGPRGHHRRWSTPVHWASTASTNSGNSRLDPDPIALPVPGKDRNHMTESTIPPTPFVRDADQAELEDWGALGEATGPEMSTSGLTLWAGEGDQEVGIWECTPGPSRWLLETNEFITVVAGRMTVTVDGGRAARAGPRRHRGVPEGLERNLGASPKPCARCTSSSDRGRSPVPVRPRHH